MNHIKEQLINYLELKDINYIQSSKKIMYEGDNHWCSIFLNHLTNIDQEIKRINNNCKNIKS